MTAIPVNGSPLSLEVAAPKPRLTFRGRHTGVAGQLSVDVTVTYPGEDSRLVSFVGNSAGGPVVMVTGEGAAGQTFVYDPNRFGSFADNPTVWVRRFFA